MMPNDHHADKVQAESTHTVGTVLHKKGATTMASKLTPVHGSFVAAAANDW